MVKMLGRICGLEKCGVKNKNLLLFPRNVIIREIHSR